MTPYRRKEIQRSEDASYRTRTSREIDELRERIKALESLLAEAGMELQLYSDGDLDAQVILNKIDAILPKTEEVK